VELVVGITTYAQEASWGVWSREAALLPSTYIDKVVAAGGVPVLLPPAAAADAVRAVDALVFAGGADLDPAGYGASAHPRTGPCHPERDAAERALLSAALETGMPILGVCRGMQLLNVVLGGGITQHLPEVVGHTDHQPAPARFGNTRVRVSPTSRLSGILGMDVSVQCYHHQAIAGIAPGLEATAWASDGTVEAVERPGDRFVVGVQWHAEEGPDVRLFAAMLDAAVPAYQAAHS
jgi:gamma-glutamyl-gamma-aminobutyrate hydrolase PuuD